MILWKIGNKTRAWNARRIKFMKQVVGEFVV
jgi:hypothetical protein